MDRTTARRASRHEWIFQPLDAFKALSARIALIFINRHLDPSFAVSPNSIISPREQFVKLPQQAITEFALIVLVTGHTSDAFKYHLYF
jgi:hypothetical protein